MDGLMDEWVDGWMDGWMGISAAMLKIAGTALASPPPVNEFWSSFSGFPAERSV